MKKLLSLLPLALCLCACAKEAPAPTHETIPLATSPAFSTQTTPREQLEEAIGLAFSDPGCTVTYGTDAVTTGAPGEQTYQALRALIPNENLVADFCGLPLIASPGQEGGMVYQVTELTLEETYALIHGAQPEEALLPAGYSQALGTVSFHVDDAGRLTELRFDMDLYEADPKPTATWSLFVQLHFTRDTPANLSLAGS